MLSAVLLLGAFSVSAWPGRVQGEGSAGEVPGDTGVPLARQNQLLRDHFRKAYPTTHESWTYAEEQFIEQFIDRQIDLFVAEVDRQLIQVTGQVELIAQLRKRLQSPDPAAAQQAERSLRAALRQLAGDCGSLARRLGLVFPGLSRKSGNPAVLTTAPQSETGQDQYLLLSLQVEAADRLVRQYLFTVNTVVELADLQGEDMLARLDSARRLAQELAK